MIRALFRILAGLAFASLVAGLVTVSFVITPAELAAAGDALPARLSTFGTLTLLAATHSAIFAAPFAFIAGAIGEWQSLRSPVYYAFVGVLIALAGFAAQYASESGATASIANNYAFKAFLSSGFFGGFAYWMLAGRNAGDAPIDATVVPSTAAFEASAQAAPSANSSSKATSAPTPVQTASGAPNLPSASRGAPSQAVEAKAAAAPAATDPAASAKPTTGASQIAAVRPAGVAIATPVAPVPAKPAAAAPASAPAPVTAGQPKAAAGITPRSESKSS